MVLEPVYQAVLAESKRQFSLPSNKYWSKHVQEDRELANQDIKKCRAAEESGEKDKEFRELLYSMHLDNFLGGLI